MKTKVPVVYSQNYTTNLYGIEKLHPFDVQKFEKLYKKLTSIFKKLTFEPVAVTDSELLNVHTQEYLDSLNDSSAIASIAEIPMLGLFPCWILHKRLLTPLKYAVGGTLLAVNLAFKYKIAINLAGGYHHAKPDSGGGFCFFADIPLAILKILNKKPEIKILIIDLDAHQGNGTEAFISSFKSVDILDIYNSIIYPMDNEVKKYITYNYPVLSGIGDKAYLEILENALQKAKSNLPEFIIYNAGTDVYKGDLLGEMNISANGIIKRDELVFKFASTNNIPIIMLLSGGYSSDSANIIAKSIQNFTSKFYSEIFY